MANAANRNGGHASALYRFEQLTASAFTLFMGGIVFLDVVHRLASHQRGILERFVSAQTYEANARLFGFFDTLVFFAVTFALIYGALRTRGEPHGLPSLLKGAAITAGIYVALRAFVFVVPNGLVWSQTLGLVLMLWVGCLGASTATFENRHLALDLGSKLWPASVLPYIQGVGNLVTAFFCGILAFLSVISLQQHFGDYQDTGGAGGAFAALPIPRFAAFSIMPLAFLVMMLRFLRQAAASFRGEVAEEDTLQMLGIQQDDASANANDAQPNDRGTAK